MTDLTQVTISEFKNNVEMQGYDWARVRDHIKHFFQNVHTPIKKAALVRAIMDKYQYKFELKTVVGMVKDYCDAGVLVSISDTVKIATTEELKVRDEQILSNRKKQVQ